MGKPKFNPASDIPSLSGKVILVTGGTSGLGKETVLSLAGHEPAHIYFTGRSQPSADKVVEDAKTKHPNTKVSFVKCDLASLSSVKRCAQEFLAKEARLNLVFANAGVMAPPAALTEEGYEIQFGTNHVGHALLVKLLTPMLEKTAKDGSDVRIVWDSSLAFKMHPSGGIQFDKVKTKQEDIAPAGAPWIRYGQSKLANLLYARAYAKHHPSITSVAIHPGVALTNLLKGTFNRYMLWATAWWMLMPPEACAWNQQWAATAKLGKGDKEVESGKYYEPVGSKGALSRMAGDDELAEKLWTWTEKELEGWNL